jgi:hypothetical protein
MLTTFFDGRSLPIESRLGARAAVIVCAIVINWCIRNVGLSGGANFIVLDQGDLTHVTYGAVAFTTVLFTGAGVNPAYFFDEGRPRGARTRDSACQGHLDIGRAGPPRADRTADSRLPRPASARRCSSASSTPPPSHLSCPSCAASRAQGCSGAGGRAGLALALLPPAPARSQVGGWVYSVRQTQAIRREEGVQ